VFGVDFILNGDRAFVVEVNPRYPASVEVIEHMQGRAVFGNEPGTGDSVRGFMGKAIYYAPRRTAFPKTGPWDVDLAGVFDPWRLPEFADIPDVGANIEAGWPVLTLFGRGSSPSAVRDQLQSRAAELDSLLADCQA
jgi:predicted ATP-grasp superfamily ATP-dependent carboligase